LNATFNTLEGCVTETGTVGFDLDMTLIDSRSAIMGSFAAVARETGVPLDLEQADARLGIKLEDELAHWFPPEQIEATAVIYRRNYIKLAAEHTDRLPGAAEAIRAVREAGNRAVIITAKHEISVEPSLRATGLEADEVFTFVHGPEKAVVLRRIGAVAYVGDTPADMAAGRAAGAVAVGVPTGSFSREDLTRAGAGVVLTDLTEFPEWYRRWRTPRRS
jgi:phosphoglycolate phosphatase